MDLEIKEQSLENKEDAASIKTDEGSEKDGAFWLCYREDGVYLKVRPAKEGGRAIDRLKMIESIKRKRIDHPRLDVISAMIAEPHPSEEKIAEPQEEVVLDEEVKVDISDDRMQAYVTLLPAEEGGALLDASGIKEELESYHVVYGIDEGKLEEIAANKPYGQKELVASGSEPQRGKDGSVTYLFATQDQSGQFVSDEKGRVDFRNVSTFERVDEGQTLVSREFATAGEDGADVFGKRLAAAKGKEAPFPKPGKNVLMTEDRSKLVSKIGGKASLLAGKVNVLPNVKIGGDVDMSVGNVDFDGDVVIAGSVNPGFAVKATGNILVHGSVEAAMLSCGGNIAIKGGIKGADKGEVIAGGNVSAPFIERTSITAGGNVITGMLVNSQVTCEGFVDVSQGRGTLVGGSINAGRYVVARTVGSDAGVLTKITIGAMAGKRQRVAELETELKKLEANIRRFELALKSQTTGASEKAKLDLKVAVLKLKAEEAKLTEEKDTLEEELLHAKAGAVHALEKIYQGVKLYFGKDAYIVPYDNEYVTYSKKQKEIEMTACRYAGEETEN